MLGGGEIARRRKPRRRAHQPGQHGRLGQRYVLGGLAEIALARLLYAVGAGPEIDAIQIEREDLLLGEFALQPQRQHHLLQLAMDGTFLSQKEIFRQLLRDGRAALRHAAMQNIGDQRARDAIRIDAVMLVEAPILDGDEGLRYVARQLFQRHDLAGHVAAHGQHAAVHVLDLDRGRPLGDGERLDRRQVGADPGKRGEPADAEPEPEHQAPIEHAADERALAAARFALAAAARRLGPGWTLAGAQDGRRLEHRLPPRWLLARHTPPTNPARAKGAGRSLAGHAKRARLRAR